MAKKLFLLFIFLITCFTLQVTGYKFQVKSAFAVSSPSFPSCTFPTGDWKVHYDEGTHGIPGDMALHEGEDDVYEVTNETTYQCFCPDNGLGIQTNWWKIPTLGQTDIDYFKRLGWIYIPSGSPWGLGSEPYLAYSFTYNCGNGGVGGGEVLGVASFAPTGNKLMIFLLLGLGVVSLLLSFLVQKKKVA